MTSSLFSGWRLKALLLSIVAAAAGYLAMSLFSGWPAFSKAATAVGVRGISILLSMSLLNYVLRALRWALYMRKLEHPLPWWPQLRIYLAGFALTTTPGKAGEAVRSVFLARHGVPYTDSLAAMFSERFSDLLAVLLLCLPGLGLYPALHPLVLLVALVAVLMLVLLSRDAWMRRAMNRLGGRAGRASSWGIRALGMLRQTSACHSGWVMLSALMLGLLAWGSEALGFTWLLHWLGIDVGLRYSVFVYAASMLAGAVSVMPGGLGGAEAAMVALLVFGGASAQAAVAATILIRLATLWFAVCLGMLVLGGVPRGDDPVPHPMPAGAVRDE